jgi:NADPH-dependent curcumin reductase CurA
MSVLTIDILCRQTYQINNNFQGFVVEDEFSVKYFNEHRENMSKWLATGEIVTKETITKGIDNVPQGFMDMLKGKNFGKALLSIVHED